MPPRLYPTNDYFAARLETQHNTGEKALRRPAGTAMAGRGPAVGVLQ